MDKQTLLRQAGWAQSLPESLMRIAPQAQMCCLTQEPRHVSIWDYAISPAGGHYFSVCAEGTTSDYARLYEYLPETNEVRRLFRLEDVIITRDEAIRPSKIHSSIAFLPDGRLIMATHTTAAAPGHPRWMPFAYYPDLWQGYPGSNLLLYDPKTGEVTDLGVPVPHESVYGGTYEESTNSYYFSGYHRGHVYRYDLATHRVTDFGQATEYGTWRYVHAPDGNLYTTTATGRLVRLNIEKQALEDVPFDFPIKPELLATGSNNKMMHCVPDEGGFYFTALSCDQLMRYDCASGQVRLCGCFVPDELRAVSPRVRCMGMAADEEGVLWLLEEALGLGLYIVSLDAAHGRAPRLHALAGSKERVMRASFGCFIRDGVLYASDTNRGSEQPAVYQVPLCALRGGESGPINRDPLFYLSLTDGEARFERVAGQPLPEAAEGILEGWLRGYYARRSPAYLATMPIYYREHPEVPFNGDLAVNVTVLPNRSRWVCKLWKRYGALDVEAVGFAGDGTVWAQAGGRRILMRGGEVTGEEPARELPENDALKEAQGVYLPHQAERRHLCGATAACRMSEGRVLAGTQDGMLAILTPGRVFSAGSVGLGQTVRQLCAFPGGRRVLGVAGGKHDLGTVFTYDDKVGLILHGRIFFQDYRSPGVLGASSQPRYVAVSPDGRYAAIAVADRLTCVYCFELAEQLID